MIKTALLIIDVQKGLDDVLAGRRNNIDAESNIALLLEYWRKHDYPIIHIQHCSVEDGSPLRPGQPGNEFKDETRPLATEVQFKKSVNSAFIGTGLENYLHQHDILNLVVVGLTTDHCVSTTVRMAANLGFHVTLIADATATSQRESYDGVLYSADDMHNINLASLSGEFCTVGSTAQVLNKAL